MAPDIFAQFAMSTHGEAMRKWSRQRFEGSIHYIDAVAERDAVEQRFWSIVDRDGITGLPSDMWAALEALVTRAAR